MSAARDTIPAPPSKKQLKRWRYGANRRLDDLAATLLAREVETRLPAAVAAVDCCSGRYFHAPGCPALLAHESG